MVKINIVRDMKIYDSVFETVIPELKNKGIEVVESRTYGLPDMKYSICVQSGDRAGAAGACLRWRGVDAQTCSSLSQSAAGKYPRSQNNYYRQYAEPSKLSINSHFSSSSFEIFDFFPSRATKPAPPAATNKPRRTQA